MKNEALNVALIVDAYLASKGFATVNAFFFGLVTKSSYSSLKSHNFLYVTAIVAESLVGFISFIKYNAGQSI